MARGVETGVGSWAALVLLLVSSSVVLGLQWNEVRKTIPSIYLCIYQYFYTTVYHIILL